MDKINNSIARFQKEFKKKLSVLVILRKDCDKLNNRRYAKQILSVLA